MPPLTFLNVSGKPNRRDAESQMKVRSQAMKDFRRKQRLEKNRPAARDLPIRPWIPQQQIWHAKNDGNRQQQAREREGVADVRLGGPNPLLDGLHEMSRGNSEDAVPSEILPAADYNGVDASSYRSSYDDAAAYTMTHMPSSQHFPNPAHCFSSHSPTPLMMQPLMGWGVDQWVNGSVSANLPRILSQDKLVQLSRMMPYFLNFVSFQLRNDFTISPLGSDWFNGIWQGVIPEARLVTYMAYYGIDRYVRTGRHEGCGTPTDFLSLHYQLLRYVRRSMNTKVMTNSHLISVVCGFAIFESLRRGPGSNAARKLHLRGMQHMIEMRGGLREVAEGKWELYPKSIVVLYLLNSILDNEVLPFVTVPVVPRLRCPRKDEQPALMPNSPLLSKDEYNSFRGGVIPPELTAVLEDALSLTEMRSDVSSRAAGPLPAPPPYRAIMGRLGAIKKLSEHMPNDVFAAKVKACFCAARIHYRATVMLVPYRDGENSDDVRELAVALRKTDLQDWEDMPCVYLWTILTGLAACAGSPDEATQRPLFMGDATRFSQVIGVYWWDHFQDTVLNLLWLQKVIRETSDPSRNGSE